MTLDRLWAGWRSDFVTGAASTGPKPDCVFDDILASGLPDTESHVIWRHPSGLVVALLNAYPYTSGHLMVMPIRHVGEIEELGDDESAAVWEGVTSAVRALKSTYQPEGINVGVNLGRAAGAGVPGHFHVHVLPRWNGDTNFMTAIADTRVLPEALGVTDNKLRAAWPGSAKPPVRPAGSPSDS
jgi:diadenosine tetraphosphate (Ap4A) HIT family hydrolase